MLVVIDEFSRECLAILAARRLRSDDVLALLTELFVAHGPPDHIRPPLIDCCAINCRARE